MAIVIGEKLAKEKSVFTGMAKASEYQYEVDPGAIRGLSPWKMYGPGKPWEVTSEGTFGVPGEASAQMAELLNAGKVKLSSGFGPKKVWDEASVRETMRSISRSIEKDGNMRYLPQESIPSAWYPGAQEKISDLLKAQEMYNLIRKHIQHLPSVEFIETLSKTIKPLPKLPGMFNGGQVSVPKFHDWNGVVPGPYGQELNAVLKSGTEGVYQNSYIAGLKKEAFGNSSTSNSNAVYNNNIVINGTDLNKKELADELMSRLDRVQKSNNKSNKVVF
jgi:hypothetical protein